MLTIRSWQPLHGVSAEALCAEFHKPLPRKHAHLLALRGRAPRVMAEQDEGKRAAVQQAMETGRRYVQSCQYGHTTSSELKAQFRAADEQVLGPIRSLLGLGEASAVYSAAAPLPRTWPPFSPGWA
jgi:hypothetical protein